MPKIIRYSDISDLNPFDACSTQMLSTCHYEGSEWFFKQPPARLADPQAKTLRILNEAICGSIVLLLCEYTHHRFLTPEHRLVINTEGDTIGLLSQKIPYENFMDRRTDKAGLERVLTMKGLAEISTIRFCIGDPDGNNNAGYGDETRLSSIDYGLANFSYLFAQEALIDMEKERLPRDRGPGVFDISVSSILSFMLQPIDDAEFLTHHAFYRFVKDLAEFSKTNATIVKEFFANAYKMLNIFSLQLTHPEFKNNIFTKLSIHTLKPSEIRISEEIIRVIIERAHLLRTTLRTISGYSPSEVERLVTEDVPDDRLSPFMLEASPRYKHKMTIEEINAIIQERAQKHFRSAQSIGKSKAEGFGEDGYRGVLFPRVTSPRMTSPLRSRTYSSVDDGFVSPPPMVSPGHF